MTKSSKYMPPRGCRTAVSPAIELLHIRPDTPWAGGRRTFVNVSFTILVNIWQDSYARRRAEGSRHDGRRQYAPHFSERGEFTRASIGGRARAPQCRAGDRRELRLPARHRES